MELHDKLWLLIGQLATIEYDHPERVIAKQQLQAIGRATLGVTTQQHYIIKQFLSELTDYERQTLYQAVAVHLAREGQAPQDSLKP